MGLLLVFPSSQIDINKLKFYLFLVKGCKNSLCVGRYRGSMEFQGCHDFFQKMFFFFLKKKTQREFGFVNALGDDGIPTGGGVGFMELDQYAGPNSWSNQDRPYPTRI